MKEQVKTGHPVKSPRDMRESLSRRLREGSMFMLLPSSFHESCTNSSPIYSFIPPAILSLHLITSPLSISWFGCLTKDTHPLPPYMASPLLLLLLVTFVDISMGSSRKLASLVHEEPSSLLKYHKGALLQRDIPISIIWYGDFTPAQKSILSDFLLSLTPATTTTTTITPSASQWWKTIEDLYISRAGKGSAPTHVLLSNQASDENCSLGKSLKRTQISALAAAANPKKGGIAVVFTAEDVAVEGFCMSTCGFHGSLARSHSAYIWVGNSASQCPGQCAWPFHQPLYGPQAPPLVAPNGDVGVDGMVINLASMVAGTVTNPFGDGYYQGSKGAPLEAATACTGVYAKGAYPGYAGNLLVEPTTGASYNAHGVNGRKYLVPALFDPSTSSCSTLI